MGSFLACVMSGGRCWLKILIHCSICLSLLCAMVGGATSSSSNETDRLALLQFKAKITYDPFGIMRLWNDSTHFCQWYGVTCSHRRERVTELSLIHLRLGGSISPHIGNLSFLHVLQLNDNIFFIHQIPPEIGGLRRLRMLNLSNNSLSGEIPRNLSSCSELKGLFLANNHLEGEIPMEVGLLSNLRGFSVSKNNLSGSLPSSLGNLTSLERLGMTYNNLVGRIPMTLGSLSHLRVLALEDNLLFGQVPSSVFNLSSMETLDVGSNQLTGRLPPNLFHTLPNLQFFSVAQNHFTGPIPVSLSNASNLKVLQLPVNKFIGKVPSLERLNMLLGFIVAANNLGSGIGAQGDLSFLCSLSNATSLKRLDIQLNNFGGIFPECITNLSSKLTHFRIFNNSISGSIPPGIGDLKGLEVLVFSYNSFTSTIPPTVGKLENLVLLYLSGNNLSGHIPSSIGNLSKLIGIDLSSNHLEGEIPSSLQNCTSLLALDLHQNNLTGFIPPQVLTIPSLSVYVSLAQNQLTGPLPEEVGKLTILSELHVSTNMLSGNIPDSLGECTSLQYLYLEGNNFQGPIPLSMSSMKGLQILDLSSNNLSGQIPDFLASNDHFIMLNLSFNDLEGAVPKKGVFVNFSATSLQGNSELCGGIPDFHLPKCSNSPVMRKKRLSVKTKVIIAMAVGLASVALVILLVCIFILSRKQRQSKVELVVSPLENQPLQIVSYRDLHRATNGFSNGCLVGAGSFGHVYKGILGEGQVVAIKVLNLNRLGASRSFLVECEALKNIRHKNLIKLLTVCSGVDYQGNEFKALVYEFMPNGSLDDWLHPPATREDEVAHDQQQTPPRRLGLLTRLRIAIDVSALLEYVHHQSGTPLVHCDIKPSNVLLDGDLYGHVSDFGLAKFLSNIGIICNSINSSSSVGVRGTIGYTPPEYGIGSEVSTQGDVYSYGILLLEMFTGKRPTDEMFKEGLSLHLYAKLALASGVVNILDPILQDLWETEDQVLNPRRSARVMDALALVIEIGVACSHESPAERMSMSMVTTKLCSIKDNLSRGKN